MDKFSKHLNIYQGIGIVITTLLGSGIFIVPSLSASLFGDDSLIGWIAMSLMIIPIAYTFGMLGNIYPHIKGSSFFVEKAFGKKVGEIIGIMYISIAPIGPPVVIITGASYLSSLCGGEFLLPISIFMLLIIFILNQYKFSLSSNIGLVIVGFIVFIVLVMSYFAFFKTNSIKFNFTNIHIFSSIGIIFWCFVGIEAVSHISSEFKNKNEFLKTIIFGVFFVGILYTLSAYSVLKFGVYGNEVLNFQSLILIFNKIIPFYGKILLSVIGFLICLIAVNLYIASITRLSYFYTKNNLSFNSNLIIIILLVAFTTTLKIIFDIKIEYLILYANGVFVLIYFFVGLSGVKLLTKIDKFNSILASVFLGIIIYIIGLDMIYAILVFISLFFLKKKNF